MIDWVKYFFLFVLLLCVSCDDVSEKDRARIDAVIQKEVKRRIELKKSIEYGRCLEALYANASEIADSILILEARLSRDSSDKPPKPNKPERPSIIALEDTTPVKPFLIDSIN